MNSNCIVVLDLDGTLIPVLVDFDKLRSEIRRLLGVDHPLRPLGESLASLRVDENLKRMAWALIEKAETESIEKLDPSELEANVKAVEHVQKLGIEVHLVTMRSLRTALIILKRLGLIIKDENIITRDFSPFRREQLRHIIERAPGKRAIFIGDTIYDELSARELGISFVMVRSYKELPEVLLRAINLCNVETA